MTDMTSGQIARPAEIANIRKRRRGEMWLKAAGLAAIGLALLMLSVLILSLVSSGYKAFTQTHVTLTVPLSADKIDPEDIVGSSWRSVLKDAAEATLPGATDDELDVLSDVMSDGAKLILQDMVADDPGLIGQTVAVEVPVSDPFDQLNKGLIDRATPEENRRLDDAELAVFDKLDDAGLVRAKPNWALVTAADSRFPELAGLKGALVGSFYTLGICFLLSFPIGIGAAIYLEEFAPKNRFSDFIEVNINNLAAVPSVVFGLLALAVFINWFGLPRSAPFVGGLTLALMVMPTIIIATRAALKAVPPSIRDAALGVGASKLQSVFHHVLPLAAPGILTGMIIGLAQALGETAPLLLIGMVAFVRDYPGGLPGGLFDPAAALPVQVYNWTQRGDPGFVERASGAIIVLLLFLLVMNAAAIILRRRYERRW